MYKSEFLSHRVNYRKLHVAVMSAQSRTVKIYSIKNMSKFIDEGITTAIANKLDKTGSDSALGYSIINARTGWLTFYRAQHYG